MFAFNEKKSINLNIQRRDAARMIKEMMKVVSSESELGSSELERK